MLARKSSRASRFGIAAFELTRDADQLLQVLDARARVVRVVGLQFAHVARLFHHRDEQIGDRACRRRVRGRSLISSAKRSSSRCFFGTARRSSSQSKIAWPTETPARVRGLDERGQRLLADAAARNVDDAPERDRVGRVHDVAQVRDHVFDLGARVEADAADDAIRDALGEKRFFEDARLRVGAVEDQEVAIGRAVADDAP